jgi:hypothetical protein
LTNVAFVLGVGRSGVRDSYRDQGGPWAKTIAPPLGERNAPPLGDKKLYPAAVLGALMAIKYFKVCALEE